MSYCEVFLQKTTLNSKFVPKPGEKTCVYGTEENELVLHKNGKNISIVWKVADWTKRKFSFVAEGDRVSLPVLFTDGTYDYVAVCISDRLILFDEMGNDNFWQLGYGFSGSVCCELLELSWAVILPLTPNNKYSSKDTVYLLFQKKQRKLYFLRGVHQGERIIYCSSDLPLLVTYDEVLETMSLVLCNEEKIESERDISVDETDLDSFFVDRVDEVFHITPKEFSFFHDELGQLYLAILDQYAYLYMLLVQGASWSERKQNNMHLEKLHLKMKLEAFISIQAVAITREEFKDLLCLDAMGLFHVYIGCQWIFRFELFWISEASVSFALVTRAYDSYQREGNQLSCFVRSLKDSVSSSVTLEWNDNQFYRISLDCFRPHSQPTKDILICSFAALKPELSCLLRSLWIFYMHCQHNDRSFSTASLEHCKEWKSLEQSLDILRNYLLHAYENSLGLSCVVEGLLSKLLNGGLKEELLRNTKNDENARSLLLYDYSFNSYLARKYSIFYKNENISFLPWEISSSQIQMDTRILISKADSIGQIVYSIATAFHLLYECYKTCVTNENQLEAVARQVKKWIALLGCSSWMEHYDRDLLHPIYYDHQQLEELSTPLCCIFDALSSAVIGNLEDLALLKATIQKFHFRGLYNPLERLEKICVALEMIFQNDNGSLESIVSIPSFVQNILPTLPLSLSTPIYDTLQNCKFLNDSYKDNWIDAQLNNLYNDDIFKLLGMEEMETSEWNMSHKLEMESMYMEDLLLDFDTSNYTSGMEVNDPCIHMRFAADRRTMEVQNLLDSASPLSLDSLDLKALYEDDSVTVSSNKLLGRLLKNLGVCIGRGAFALGTYISFDPTEPIVIPKICLAAKAPSDSLPLVKLDMSSVSVHYFDWPRFHNGVAASLRFFRREPCYGDPNSPETMLSRSWIVSNKPPEPCASHAGVLLGLGLTGHLPVLQTTDWYSYLIGRDELTCVGLILGVACSGRGTMDNSATKMLCIHIRHFNPLSFSQPEWEVPVSVQSAACFGLGLLYQGTCHRLMVEGLYAEMTRNMEPDIPLGQRQGFCLAVGFGLGFICLGMGPKSAALQDLHLEEKLYSCIYGKNTKSTSQSIILDTHPNVILENYSNNDVITPAALMALCLMYLQTNDWSVANMLTIPESLYELESIRPDHLYLFVLSRQLILWDYIYATPSYLINLLPSLCKNSLLVGGQEISLDALLEQLRRKLSEDNPMTDIIVGTIMILLAAAVSIGLRYAGTFDSQAYTLVKQLFLSLEKIVPTHISMYLGLLPLSLSLIMAGSGNLELLRILRRLHKSIRHKSDTSHSSRYANYMMNSMSIGFLFLGGGSCSFQRSRFAIASLLCALYPVFPASPTDNQYHLQAFRHFYILATENRLLETRDIRTNKPCFVPIEITLKDSRDYYSSTWRLMSPCLVPEWTIVEKIQISGPRYLPRTFVIDENFLEKNSLLERHRKKAKNPSNSNPFMKVEYGRIVVFVRRRMGQLDYSMDPKGTRGLLSRVIAISLKGRMLTSSWPLFHSFPIQVDTQDEIAMESLMEYPSLSGFFQYFCEPTKPSIYDAILYEILSHDKPEALQLYLEMMNICNCSMAKWSLHSLSMKHLSILSQYFHYGRFLNNSIMNDEHIPILEPTFVQMCFLHQ
ncbi:anaphase-promoting complex subunit 1 [Galdieria sulphuraria]|uniref:Anaphase-promoting complex subunit 1 n=1 Tax=Galdieria sulphuraria TaxID=130081 RepID=M2WW99_GALSU|nr:anaphase-promoting complex subunit 1 [Galdieria sulphuraria]EME28285.1 anaphase-promoting complex subunit 1 [Galdieria sulphuraria]|eukprot:XP_005704805.1 anaphase-promoting complex subunit 1 [Galdieria sulphuraria]